MLEGIGGDAEGGGLVVGLGAVQAQHGVLERIHFEGGLLWARAALFDKERVGDED